MHESDTTYLRVPERAAVPIPLRQFLSDFQVPLHNHSQTTATQAKLVYNFLTTTKKVMEEARSCMLDTLQAAK